MLGGESRTAEPSSGAESSRSSVMVLLHVPSLVSIDMKGNPHGISQRWKWRWSFKLYFAGKGVTHDAQKGVLLLQAVGVDVKDVYFTVVNEYKIMTLENMMNVLDDYFVLKANVPFVKHLFRKILKASDKTVDHFVCKL